MWKSPSPLLSLQTSFFPAFHSALHPPCGTAFFTEQPWHCVPPLPHPALVSPYPAQNWRIATVLLFLFFNYLTDTLKLIRSCFLLNVCFLKIATVSIENYSNCFFQSGRFVQFRMEFLLRWRKTLGLIIISIPKFGVLTGKGRPRLLSPCLTAGLF